MNIPKDLKNNFPIEIIKIIQSYLVDDYAKHIDKIEKKYKLICKKCKKEYFSIDIKFDDDLCPCYPLRVPGCIFR